MVERIAVDKDVKIILFEDKKRDKDIHATFNPITGEGAFLERKELVIEDFPVKKQFVPVGMLTIPLIKEIIKAGSINEFGKQRFGDEWNDEQRGLVIEQIVRLRCKYDFCFWAASFVFIKNKGGGEDVRFRLNRPQRKLITAYEKKD